MYLADLLAAALSKNGRKQAVPLCLPGDMSLIVSGLNPSADISYLEWDEGVSIMPRLSEVSQSYLQEGLPLPWVWTTLKTSESQP